jgi:hypothetical protein
MNGQSLRLQEFHKLHGDCVVINDWIVFEDGAIRETNSMGLWKEPPVDIYEKNKLIVRFHQAKLTLALDEFNTLKKNLMFSAQAGLMNGCPCTPPEEQKEALKMLKDKVNVCKKKLDDANELLLQSKPDWLKFQEEQEIRDRQNCQRFLNDISQIEV